MEMTDKKKLVILSGPSCVGKGPLRKALQQYYSGIKYAELVLCTSRRPRLKKDTGSYEVHGLDYYFLPRGLFSQLDQNRFIVGNVRSDIQAIDMLQVRELLQSNDLILAEVFHTLGRSLMEWVGKQFELEFDIRSVSLTPLSEQEIQEAVKKTGKKPEQIVYEAMKIKLERRGEDSSAKVEERASSAFEEIEATANYTDHIINHAGEDDKGEWSDPLGSEATRVLNEFVAILTNKKEVSIIEPEIAEWFIEFGPVQPGPGPGDGSDASIYSEIFRGTSAEAEQRGNQLCEEYRKSYPTGRFTGHGYMERTEDEEFPLYSPEIGRFNVGHSITRR